MRITDDRYTGELDKFSLAVRMIRHEARTGTIRRCTGFSEDRIRKLYAAYFKSEKGQTVRRRRGKSPRQIARFVTTTRRQTEATLLACMCRLHGAFLLDCDRKPTRDDSLLAVTLGEKICDAYELYQALVPDAEFSFEWTWNLYHALVESNELYFAWCANCSAPYVQDTYALDYRHCPICEIKTEVLRGNRLKN